MRTTIPKISRKSRATELAAVITNLIEAYREVNLAEDTHLQAIFDLLKSKNKSLITAINCNKRESLLKQKDGVRNEAVRALVALVEGYRHFPEPAVREAAVQFFAIFNKYGLSILKESYAIESTLLCSLLEELTAPATAAVLAIMPGTVQLLAKLSEAQEAFQAELTDYEAEKAEESTLKSATTIKNEIFLEANGTFVLYLKAMARVDAATYGSFAQTASQLIGDSNSAVNKRVK